MNRAMSSHNISRSLVEPLSLGDDGLIPNSRLPLLLYVQAIRLPAAPAIQALFARNGWQGLWINGIYPFHHYHSTAHEVLGVFSGSAQVQFGGDQGVVRTLEPGDVAVIPAGVGHKNLGCSPDFGVVGAYPEGQDWDMCYGKPEERPRADQNIARVPLPQSDPVSGATGPLIDYWRRSGRSEQPRA